MDINGWNIVIPALAGLIGVAIGSLKPLIDWQIEKKRLVRTERKILVEHVRAMIIEEDFYEYDFIQTVEYSKLRPYLSNEMKSHFERGEKRPYIKGNQREPHTFLLDEINRLERKWALL